MSIDPPPAPAIQVAPAQAFTADQFELLKFIEGRWTGNGPDGIAFFDEFSFPEKAVLRVRRSADPNFVALDAEGKIALEEGAIVSRWGERSWKVVEIGTGMVRFEPVTAEGGFTWRRVDDDTIEVTQRWREAGRPRASMMLLHRLK